MKMKFGFVLLITLTGLKLSAQDIEFSQFYASPLMLNPGFVGTTGTHRFISNYRNQWPSVATGFTSFALSYDLMLPEIKSGIGMLLTSDQAGTASLKSQVANFLYSYKVNVGNKFIISPGLNFGLGYRSIDINRLLFGDQLDLDLPSDFPTSDPLYSSLGSTFYFDFGSSILLYNRKAWIGLNVAHLNQPNRSLLGDVSTQPRKYSFHGGLRVNIFSGGMRRNRTAVLLPSWNYKVQADFKQLDLGAQLFFDPVIVGFYYRGIPFLKERLTQKSLKDAVVVMLGLQFENLEFGYSYDLSVSQLGPSTGGAHEISLKYEIPRRRDLSKKIRHKLIPCPTLYNNRDLNMDKLRQ